MTIILLYCSLLGYIYQDADSLMVSDHDSLVICGVHHYNIKVQLWNGGWLKVRPGSAVTEDTLGWLLLHAISIHVRDSSMIYGTGSGFPGGTNAHSDGWGPGGGQSGTSGGGGGAGYGGDGGDGGDSNPGAGGSSYGDPADTVIERGSGGGAGRLSQVDGWGGNGGAKVYLKAHRIIVDSSSILASGATAVDASMEGGGGGSGGGILVRADTIFVHGSRFEANGGSGGSATFGGGGGAGGGRIKFLYSNVLDTAMISMTVIGGAGGMGGYGDGENGAIGSIYIGTVVSIEDEKSVQNRTDIAGTLQVRLYPNPGSGTVFLERRTGEWPLCAKVRIADCTGRVIASRMAPYMSGSRRMAVDLSDLGSGAYFILIDGQGPLPMVLVR